MPRGRYLEVGRWPADDAVTGEECPPLVPGAVVARGQRAVALAARGAGGEPSRSLVSRCGRRLQQE